MNLPSILYEFAGFFKNKGFQCFLVGGAVRDRLIGKESKDFDFTTDAPPDEVIKIFRRVIPTGIKHGTVTVLFKREQFEVTTFRIEGKYKNKRHPDKVIFTPSLEEDLARRDFTINAIAYDLIHKKIIDPYKGQKDLKARLIRAIGIPEERFNEDGLRLMRACRFAAKLNFIIDPPTFRGMKTTAENIRYISSERIRDELLKTICSPHPVRGLELLREAGILKIILPELTACRGITQRSRHKYDVYYHSLYACEGAPGDSEELRTAALLHDIGKPLTAAPNEAGENTFYNHEKESARLADQILFRLKLPNNFRKKVCHLIEHHMFNYTEDWNDSAVRRFLARVGSGEIRDLIALRMADKYGTARCRPDTRNLQELLVRIENVLKDQAALTIKDLAISGKDLINTLGLKPGRHIGLILNFLLEGVIDDPRMNTKKILLEAGKKYYDEKLNLKK